MAQNEDIGTVAELIGKTLQRALDQVEGIPAIWDLEWRDLGEVDFRLSPRSQLYRMTIQLVGEDD